MQRCNLQNFTLFPYNFSHTYLRYPTCQYNYQFKKIRNEHKQPDVQNKFNFMVDFAHFYDL